MVFYASLIISSNSRAGIVFNEDLVFQETISTTSYNEIIECSHRGVTKCDLILGMAYDREVDFKDKKITANADTAAFYFRKISAKGPLARYYLAGSIAYTYPLESKSLLLSAATEGEIHAIYDLGHPYHMGNNDEINKNIKWIKTLINKSPQLSDNETAVIGSLYLLLTPPDYSLAAYWLEKSSNEYGDLLAQGKLARLYEKGLGVKQDLIKAYMYYDLAGTSANEAKQTLAHSMTQEQIEEAITQSHQWQDEHKSYRPGYGAWNDMGGIEWHVH